MKGGIQMSFVHLQVYSAYSLLTSTITIEKLVTDAKSKGFSTIALTDRNVMYGAVAFYKECIKNNIKPIIGLTVDVTMTKNGEKSYPLVLLAKNNDGYQNLLKISSAVQTKSLKGIPIKWLKAYTKGLFALTPGKEGIIETYLAADKQEEARKTAQYFSKMFEPNSLYLTIQAYDPAVDDTLIKKMVVLAKEVEMELVVTNNVHYLSSDDLFAYSCLLAMKKGQQITENDDWERIRTGHHYLKTAAEMNHLFQDYPKALKNTVNIAEQCQVTLNLNNRFLPRFPIDETTTSDEFLEKLCNEGLHMRYHTPTEEHRKRLAYELQVIKRMQFSDYFLIVWDIVKYAREQGILTGPGRGSAAGSLVAYVLFITNVDPIQHNLLFERFLNPERITMPDIDIDFPDYRRDEIIKYVVNKYGQLHVAQIITFGTLAAKAVIRDVGKVFGFSVKEIEKLSRLLPAKQMTLTEAIGHSRSLQAFIVKSNRNRLFLETACKLEGLPRHTSTHAAGVVISEKPLVDIIPIQAGHDGIYLTQYPMDHLEALGLLKMDFLGLRNLSLIDSIIQSIQRKTGRKIDISAIPFDDEQTYQLLSQGNTSGVFQLESAGMQKVLRDLKPTHFEDIVAVNALYRPGPMENISTYVDRKHGRQKVTYPHPDLKPILENTYGVIVYQEQIMEIAATMAGFTLGEADLLRKAVGKKQTSILQAERQHFVQGACKKGYNEDIANAIYDLIVRFADYGFNRSHAVAYSMIAYQLSFLKTHYPLYFMAELLTTAIGNEQKLSDYIMELKELGFSVLAPSINMSTYSFQVANNHVRYSLAAIKGVGAVALKEIFSARSEKRFSDLFDFCIRVRSKAVNRKTLEALVYSGSFDEFGKDRAVLLATLDAAMNHAQLVQPVVNGQDTLFFEEGFAIKPKYVEVEPMTLRDKLHYEKLVLGLYLSNHPVSIHEATFASLHTKPIHRLLENEKGVQVGALISRVKKIRTKKGEAMAFLTVSDQSGEMDAVVFPNVYRRFSTLLKEEEIVLLTGNIERRNNRIQLIVQTCQRIEDVIHVDHQMSRTLYVRINHEIRQSGHLHQLKRTLKDFPGKTPVVLYYEEDDRAVRLDRNHWVNASEQCISQITNLLGKENVVLKD